MYKIYKITNLINNHFYIGYTKQSVEKRFNQHCNSSSSKMVICKAIKKYGIENFKVELIEQFDSQVDAINKEIQLIESMKPEYNIHIGGTGGPMYGPMNGMYGKKHTNEWKAHKSLLNSGEKNPMFGRSHSEEAKQKISASRKGKPTRLGQSLSEEHKQKLRVPKSELTKQKMRNTYLVNGIVINNAKQYCIENNLNYVCFTQAAKKQKPYKGMIIGWQHDS